MATTTATQIQQLYVGLLGRAADQGGLNWWADQVTTGGKTLEDVRASFVTSTEYTTTYGAATTRADLVTSIYQNLFERTPSADEVKYWAETDTRPADQLVAAFIEFAGAADQAVINNKTFVAQTYTDTVGTNFNQAASAQVIADVDGTSASVEAALASITTGTLPGLVPGISLINTLVEAQAATAAYGETAAKANPTLDGAEDGVLDSAEADNALQAADDARFDVANGGVSASTTRQLQATAGDLADDLATTKKAVEAVTGGAAAVKAYEAAFTKDATATATLTAAAPTIASAEAGLDKAVIASGATVTFDTLSTAAGVTPDFTSADQITAFLGDTANAGTPVAAKLIAELSKVPTYGAGVVDAGAKTLAANTAAEALVTASSTLNDIDLNGAASGNTYIADKLAATNAAELVKDAQAADAAIVTAQAVVDKYTALEKAESDAADAIDEFAGNNATKVSIQDLGSTAPAPAADADKVLSDVFYFKAAVTSANDLSIANFAAGDSIVIGSGYTAGTSFATGNNNALEYFFVQTDTGTQVVLETQNYGSSQVTASATAGVTATGSDNLAVITLTGVTADHLSVNNGVISYV